ncbi:hypothetical protein ISCGN_023294 [Ixodes scapularis]
MCFLLSRDRAKKNKRNKKEHEKKTIPCPVSKLGPLDRETILRFTFRPSTADARSHPSQCGVEGVSCDLELPVSPRPTGRSRDFLPALDRLGWLVASTALGLKVKRSIARYSLRLVAPT